MARFFHSYWISTKASSKAFLSLFLTIWKIAWKNLSALFNEAIGELCHTLGIYLNGQKLYREKTFCLDFSV